MDFLAFFDDKKTLAEHLKPLKDRIELTLGHGIESYQIGVDMTTKEFKIQAGGKYQIEKNVMMCFTLSQVIKRQLKKKGLKDFEFKAMMLHITDTSVSAAIKSTNNSIETLELSSNEILKLK